MTPYTQYLRQLRRPFCRALLRVTGTLPALFVATAAAAATPIRPYNIPAGDAVASLATFATQSGEQLVYSADAIEGIKTNAIRGRYTAAIALQRMLDGTGLVISTEPRSGVLAISGQPPELPSNLGPGSQPGVLPAAALAGFVSAANDRAITLTPFEVRTDRDNSYGALQSNSLTAFSMDLDKMPASAEVFTQTFIRDTNAQTIEELLLNYSGMVGYNPSDSAAYSSSIGDRDGGGGLSINGFSASAGNSIKRDGFFGPTISARTNSGATSTFDIERVEVISGPQSLLYGAVGAGGVINAVSKRGEFGVNRGSVVIGFDSLGSKNLALDYNLGGEKIALRVAGTTSETVNARQNLANGAPFNGIYGQLALKVGPGTVVRLMTGKTESQNYFSFKPSFKPFFDPADPRVNQDTNYLAATGQLNGLLGGVVNWNNVDSFGNWWAGEPITNRYSSLVVESQLLPWLAAKAAVVYNEMRDWRNTSSLTLQPPGAGGNPFATPAILVNPSLNFQSQRLKAFEFTVVATNDFFHDRAHSQTLVGGYVNHTGPSFGSSGISYNYFQADSNWNALYTGLPTSQYGRVILPSNLLWYPIVNAQIPNHPLFRPGTPRVTISGQNYILMPTIASVAADKTAANPFGLVPNNGATGFTGSFNPGAISHEGFLNFANYTDWLTGKFQTLAGVSLDRETTFNPGATVTSVLPWTTYSGFEVGGIYQFSPAFGAYVTVSTAASPYGTTNDLDGRPLQPPKARSPVPEIGLKWHRPDGRYSAQLTYDFKTTDRNEIQAVDVSYQNAVNPNGINGRFGGTNANNFVNIDRAATSARLSLTANPSPAWRLRFNASYIFGRVQNEVSYAQLYNDEFYANGAGQVTYQNGTPVYVNGAAIGATDAVVSAPGAANATPLTIAMLNTVAGPYAANPDPTSGTITNPALRTILTNVSPDNGPIATGATGLPLSAMQYVFTSPFPKGNVTVFKPGDLTTGYVGWQYNFVTDYTIDHGPLKGLGALFSGVAQYSNRAYYTYLPKPGVNGGTLVVNETRQLYGLPTSTNFNLGLHYEFKVRHHQLTSRVNVTNLFNHDPIYLEPQPSNGSLLQVVNRNPPRLWSWTTEIDF